MKHADLSGRKIDALKAEFEPGAVEARLRARGLVPVWTDQRGFHKPVIVQLRLWRFPASWELNCIWTTPTAAALLLALEHAQKLWPLQSMREIADLIGLSGLREFHAVWVLDAADVDLSELLNNLAKHPRRQRR